MLLLLSAASAAARAPGPRDGRGSPALSPPPPKRPEGGGVLVDEALGETLADLSPPCPPRLPPTTAKTRLQEKKRWLERGERTTEGPIEGGWLSWLPKSAINPFLSFTRVADNDNDRPCVSRMTMTGTDTDRARDRRIF